MGEDVKGSVGSQITLAPEDPNNALVTLRVRGLTQGPAGRDEYVMGLATTLFRHLFKPGFSHHSLEAENFCVLVEVPLEMLRDEWVKVVEDHPNGGGDYAITDEPAPFPLNFPIVVDKDEEG